jgi:hypothetical protein
LLGAIIAPVIKAIDPTSAKEVDYGIDGK